MKVHALNTDYIYRYKLRNESILETMNLKGGREKRVRENRGKLAEIGDIGVCPRRKFPCFFAYTRSVFSTSPPLGRELGQKKLDTRNVFPYGNKIHIALCI